MGRKTLLLLVLAVTCVADRALLAQTQRGTIVGTIADPTGAVVPSAKVQVVNDDTGAQFGGLSNTDGYYNVPYLPYGKYTVNVPVAGFKVYTVHGVEVAAATTTTLNIVLEVGSQTQEVSVTATPVVLEASTSSVGTNIEQKLKDDLPVANRRNPLTYLYTVPGYQPSVQSTLAGARFGSNSILLDGQAPDVSIVAQGDTGNPALPSVESIGEFNVLLNSVPAEYGRTGGPTISFATRSGTNELHGAAYEYYGNSRFNARPWQAASRGTGYQHYFGAVAGGPVWIPKLYNGRNKSFFFVDYSDIRNSSAGTASAITTLPSAAMRQGDFSASDILPIYDVLSARTDASGNVLYNQFPGNQIPLTRESKVSKNLLDLIPVANRPGSINNFVGSLPPIQSTQWLLSLKGDHYISANDRLSGYFQASRPQMLGASLQGENFGDATRSNFNRIRLDWSRNFTPRVSQQLLFGLTRQWGSTQSRNFGQNIGQKAGLTGLLDPNCPRIEVDRAQQSVFTMCFNLANITAVTNTTMNYSLLVNRGPHTFKWGVEYIKFNQNSNARSSTIQDAAGAFNFGGIPPRPTVSPIRQNATSQTDSTGGNSWADFYLGLPKVASVSSPVILGYRQPYFAAYLQDDWRVTRKLTINAGLRWDLDGPYSEVHGQISRFDSTTPNPGAAGRLGALVFYGNGPGQLGTNIAGDYHFRNFAPRLGFAYQFDNRTVIRGFGGMLYAGVQNTNVDFATRDGFQAAGEPLTPANRFSLYYNWDQLFPQNVLGKVPNIDPALRNGQGTESQDPDGVARAPVSYMWSLSVQREVRFGILLETDYIANNMKHGTDRLQLNFLPQQYWKLGPLLDLPLNSPQVQAAGFGAPYPGFNMTSPLYQALLRYPQYLGLREDATNGTSGTYHALILKAQKRFSSGLSFLANYTVSKFITDSQWLPGAFGSFPTVPNNRALDKGLYRFDVPQRLVLNYSYDLPFGKRKKFLGNSRVLDLAFGGWTITGIQQYQRGVPASFSGSFNKSIPTVGGGALRVVGVPTRSSIACGDLQYANPQRNYLFNAGNPAQAASTGRPLAFAPAGDYQIGNIPRIDPQGRQCGREDEDLAIFKSFTIRESVRFRFGAESFNLLNRHTWVSGVNGQSITAPNFGEIVPDQPFGPRVVRLKFRMEW
jgi:hypothetical protein